MFKKICKRILPMLLSALLIFTAMPLQVAATTITTLLDGQISITDSANNMTESGGVVTAKITGGTLLSKTNTLTITNDSGSKAIISFDYSASNASSCKVAGVTSTSGTYTTPDYIDNGETITVALTAARKATATLTLSNFTITKAAASSDVTFEYDSSLGSVTVDGTAIPDGDVITLPSSGSTLVATPVSGATFLGWVNAADGAILSQDANFTFGPSVAMTVKAMFINADSVPHFMLGALTEKSFYHSILTKGIYWTVASGTHLFDNLADAAATSASTSSKGIVLMNSGTLPAGDYTIPAGSTLLIPFDAANTLYKTIAQGREHNSSTEVTSHNYTIYRKLTMADGANIELNGAMSLSAKHLYAQGNRTGGGSPVDAISQVEMQGNSSITVNNGGALYVYGYIYGSGSVLAKNGATVYENFQIMDFRGGTQSTSMENGVFPFSQYYIQNIEVPMKLEYGAKEYSLTTIYMSSTAFTSAVNFIGPSNSMFNLTKGYVTKRYDGSTDRLIVELNGELDVSSVEMKVGTSSINSKDYELPINSNLSITAKTGSKITMNQDIAMLPGAEIILEQGANCTIGSGINVYLYDADNWGNYSGAGTDTAFKPVTHAMTRTYNRTNADLVDAKIQVDGTIDATAGYVYTTAGGANAFSTGSGVVKVQSGTQTETHQFIYTGTQYVAIPITPAKLKNANGSYVQSVTDTYTYSDGKWHCSNHVYDPADDVVTNPTCTEQGYTTHTCNICADSKVDTPIAATGHSYTSVETKPTCTEQGYTEYTCVTCGHTYKDNYVAALVHNYTSEVTAPTCTEQGYTTHTCSNCGDSYVDSYVDVIDHNFGEWQVRTAAGCESEGVKYRTCGDCKFEETSAISATGHSYNAVVTKPTCTEQGYTTYNCTACTHSYVADYVAATGHSHNAVVTAPTCTEQGFTTYTCACGDSYVADYVDAKGHSYNAVVTAPTCTEQGYTTYTCAVCGNSYVADYVAATGHSFSDWIVRTDADCETAGEEYRTCACGEEETQVILAKGHNYNSVVTAPTCTEAGYTTHTCSACSHSYTSDETAALGHSYDSVVTEPTCTESGYTTHTCSACGDTYTDSEVEATGHTFDEWEVKKAASHKDTGLKVHTCACGHSEEATIPVIICDIDNDEKTFALELSHLRKALLDFITFTDDENVMFDMNDDGKINVIDLVALKKAAANNTAS